MSYDVAMLLRAVKFEVLILVDMHVSGMEAAELILQGIEISLDAKQIEIDIIEDHETYFEQSGEHAQS